MAEILQDSPTLACHRCGYDLRAHLESDICPECAAPVAESKEFARVPTRPAWKDSDPRWRRRMIAGAWILTLMPLLAVLQGTGLHNHIPWWTPFGLPGTRLPLAESFVFWPGVYEVPILCSGAVLLFSKERFRRRSTMDWTRRWGVLMAYVVFLVGAAGTLFLVSLVGVGIAALFMSMPVKYQPVMTEWLRWLTSGYLTYGLQPAQYAHYWMMTFSTMLIVLALKPIYDALRCAWSRTLTLVLVGSLGLCALIQLTTLGMGVVDARAGGSTTVAGYQYYFANHEISRGVMNIVNDNAIAAFGRVTFVNEVFKWGVLATIAALLTIAQIKTWRGRSRS